MTTLSVSIESWSDSVGTLDPAKVLGLVERAFPDAILDPTDHQEEFTAREMEHLATLPEPQRSIMSGQSRRRAQDNGPAFRFEIPDDSGTVKGLANRYGVSLELPDGIDEGLKEKLERFLRGLKLGELRWDD